MNEAALGMAGAGAGAGRQLTINCDGSLGVAVRPPANPPLKTLRLKSPLDYLKRFKLQMSFFDSAACLNTILNSVHFLKLYQHYFPVEFAASNTSLFPVSGSHDTSEGAWVYSPREVEFFYLVNERLFPLDLDTMFEYDLDEGIRSDMIHLEYSGHGFAVEDNDYTDYGLGWQLVASIFSYFASSLETPDTPAGRAYERLLAKLDHSRPVDSDVLKELCWAEGAAPELTYLPLARDVLNHNTDNCFIDPDYTYPVEDAMWSEGEEIIDFLTEAHKKAHRIWDDCEILMEWIEKSPKNYRKVIEVCKKAQQPLKEQEQVRERVRILTGTMTSEQFLHGLESDGIYLGQSQGRLTGRPLSQILADDLTDMDLDPDLELGEEQELEE